MKKYNLPVIILNGLVLLPNNMMKLEYDEKRKENNVIDMSLLFHSGEILITNSINDQLSKIAVVGKIENKLELPNGSTRIDIVCLKRVEVIEYINNSTPLESIISDIDLVLNSEEEMILQKLKNELNDYVKVIPYISNSILSLFDQNVDLSNFIDSIVPNLNFAYDKMLKYLVTVSAKERAEMLLKDIYTEKEFFDLERKLDSKIKKNIDNTQKEFILREKIKLIKEELGDKHNKENEIDDLKQRVTNLDGPDRIKEKLNYELNRLESMTAMTPEINITRDYIDWLLNLPWNVYTKDNENLTKVKKELDNSHYGLEEVKTRVIEYLAVKKMTNSLKGPILCLVGPPGVGKTSLAYSIASAINRRFVKIAVGGIKDVSEIMGHRRTYVGANPGRIISSLKKAGSNNPVFLIDEIDKMSSDYKGDPITSLLSVLDPEQNKYFSDNYIEEDYDLSNVMFILTANSIDDIPAPIKDRLEIINLSGYTEFEKLDIAKKHLLSKICNENGLKKEFIHIDDKVILEIIQKYTKEAGVRELERQITKIVRKVVTQIVVNNIKVNKMQIDSKSLEKYLGRPKYPDYNKNNKKAVGVVNGLAYTVYGGDTLPIEVNYFKGSGRLVLTGSLGEVMKESANIALSYIKSNYKLFNISYDKLIENDIHIHVPEGAIKKDGPSAGISLTLALVSALTNQKIASNLALTGEITLQGRILAIGGLKEKSVGALRNGIKRIIIPYDNLSDVEELPKEVKSKIEFIGVKNFKNVIDIINNKMVTN